MMPQPPMTSPRAHKGPGASAREAPMPRKDAFILNTNDPPVNEPSTPPDEPPPEHPQKDPPPDPHRAEGT